MRRQVLVLSVLLAVMPMRAQVTQPLATLPEAPQYVGYAGGKVLAYSAGVLLAAQYKDDDIVAFSPDTFFVKIDDGVNYVVQHPETGDYYYTVHDRKGRSCLYMAHREPYRFKTKRVKMGDMEVEHPVFNADGSIMVFSAMDRTRGYGGYDLWYSTFKDGEWQVPCNMGSRVNSQGDEVSPWIAGGYLFYSSNAREEGARRQHVYTTRLIAQQVVGDTVGMLQIGRSRVQQLPVAAGGVSYGFVVDSARNGVYWYDAAAGMLRHKGPLQAVTLWGHVWDVNKNALRGTRVLAMEGERTVTEATTQADGSYHLTLPAGKHYTIEYRQKNCYKQRQEVSVMADANNLVGELQKDAMLDGLPVGRQIHYFDLFGPDAVVDFSAHGIEQLDDVVRFVRDNPTLQVQLTLTCDLTEDEEYNALLTGHRLRVLEDYLLERMPADVTFIVRNGCDGAEGCSGATGETNLTVVLK